MDNVFCTACESPLNTSNHFGDEFKICKSCWELFLQGRSELPKVVLSHDHALNIVRVSKENSLTLDAVPITAVSGHEKPKMRLFT